MRRHKKPPTDPPVDPYDPHTPEHRARRHPFRAYSLVLGINLFFTAWNLIDGYVHHQPVVFGLGIVDGIVSACLIVYGLTVRAQRRRAGIYGKER